MIDPMIVILAPPGAVFGWILFELRRDAHKQEPEPVRAPAATLIPASLQR